MLDLLYKTVLARVLAAILLMAFPPSVSEIICVNHAGHEEVEYWASTCCAPAPDAPGTNFSEAGACQGCTDYPAVQPDDIKRAQLHSWMACHHDSPVLLAEAWARLSEVPLAACGRAPERMPDPAGSPVIPSLRC